jgi:hypothetical protein
MRRVPLALIAALLLALLAACPRAGSRAGGVQEAAGEPPAAPVPTHVLTEADVGRTQQAEQGDHVSVRLRESPDSGSRWQLAGVRGPALETTREALETERVDGAERPVRVYSFFAAAVGRSELLFERGSESLVLAVEVR